VTDEKKAWGGRFSKSLDAFVEEFGASLPVDRRMWEQDIKGSMAHARMLARQGIISEADADAIETGLSEIYREICDGKFTFDIADEDIHMSIERKLIDRIGPAGGRLHTGRSRNDQVALDTRMYAKDAIIKLSEGIAALRETLLDRAREHQGALMPGYTHMQKAQPVLFSHHLLAYFWMLTRDAARLRVVWDETDVMPLGSAALAGTTFPIDREWVAERLGFEQVSQNSLDAVSDRDFLVDLTHACAMGMVHLSRICEELIIWSTDEFGFVSMDDSFATGSSIMPQKRNPDFAELVRGKTGRAIGDLVALLAMLKGLPFAYNKDMQEDKEAAFDAIDTFTDSLRAVEGMVRTMRVDESAMRLGAMGGFTAATDLADYLAGKGMPFRNAHEVVGRLVLECERRDIRLQDLSADELSAFAPEFGSDAIEAIDIDRVVARRMSVGGTAPERVSEQVDLAVRTLDEDRTWLRDRKV